MGEVIQFRKDLSDRTRALLTEFFSGIAESEGDSVANLMVILVPLAGGPKVIIHESGESLMNIREVLEQAIKAVEASGEG